MVIVISLLVTTFGSFYFAQVLIDWLAIPAGAPTNSSRWK